MEYYINTQRIYSENQIQLIDCVSFSITQNNGTFVVIDNNIVLNDTYPSITISPPSGEQLTLFNQSLSLLPLTNLAPNMDVTVTQVRIRK